MQNLIIQRPFVKILPVGLVPKNNILESVLLLLYSSLVRVPTPPI
jgi:hypothetical protein